MKKVCSVQGCRSGSKASKALRLAKGLRHVTLFKVPKNRETRQVWAESLGVVFEETDSVCELHFCQNDILREDVHNIGGKIHVIPRMRYTLCKGAIPKKDVFHPQQPLDVVMEEVPLVLQAAEETLEEVPEKAFEEASEEAPEKALEVVPAEVSPVSMHVSLEEEFSMEMENDFEMQRDTFTMSALRSILLEKPLRPTWCWVSNAAKQDEIIFMQAEPITLEPRIRLFVHGDLTITMQTADRLASLKLEAILNSFSDVVAVMEAVESVNLCTGPGVENQSRSENCCFYMDANERYLTQRCVHCRKIRRLELHNNRRREKRAKTRYGRSKRDALNERRRYQRLMTKTRKLRAELQQSKTACAAVRKEALEEKITQLPEIQQRAVMEIFEAAQAPSKHARRYSIDWIYECLLMRIKNDKLYTHLRDRNILPLPCKNTLKKYIQRLDASKYGFQQAVFECMRRKGLDMDIACKRGVLLVDEMKISERVTFDRQSMQVNGFVDLGIHTPKHLATTRADHALVFMFQPFRGAWVQVLGCFLSKHSVTSSVLHKLILECIILIGNTTFHVDAVVMDGAQWNRGVWTLFGISETNLRCVHPYDPSKHLRFVSDFPHLIKCFRNGIVRREEFLTPDGVVKKAHWQALLNFENFVGPSLKIAFQLTPDHLNPKGYQKMNVPIAFQLFSEQVEVAMAIYGKDGRCPGLADSAPTQAFIKRINKLITPMMSRTPLDAIYFDDRYHRRKAIRDFLEYLQVWEHSATLQKEDLPISTSTLSGLKVSLGATLQILDSLHEENQFDYIMGSRLNQDALERFFGLMRASCGSNDHPDAWMFAQVFRLLCTYSLVKPPRGSNVTGPELLRTLMQTEESLAATKEPRERWLQRLDNLLESGDSTNHEVDQSETNPDVPESTMTQSTNSHLTDHSYDVYSTSDEVQSYLAGYIVRKMHRFVKCEDCLKELEDDGNEHREARYQMIELINRGKLKFPSENVFLLTKALECACLDVVGKMGVSLDTLNIILDKLAERQDLPVVGCKQHANTLSKKIIDFYLVMRGHFLCKAYNANNNNNQAKSRMHRKQAKL